jgi:hypothetical protein
VLEVNESLLENDSTSAALQKIVNTVNSNEGLNIEGDVAVTFLNPVSKS